MSSTLFALFSVLCFVHMVSWRSISFSAARPPLLQATLHIQHQSRIVPLRPASSPYLLKCSVTFAIAIPATHSIHTSPQHRNLPLNYGLSNSLNMFIFPSPCSWSCPQEIDFLPDSHPFIKKKVLCTNFFIFFADGLVFFVLCFCPDSFLHDKKLTCQKAIE